MKAYIATIKKSKKYPILKTKYIRQVSPKFKDNKKLSIGLNNLGADISLELF